MNNAPRRLAVGGFATAAAFIVLAGVAFACVPFKGTAAVSSASAGSQNSGTTTGDGSANQMRFCGNTATPGSTTVTEAQNKGGDVITVTVGAATCASPGANSQLSNRNHTVIINNATTTGDAPFSLAAGTPNTWSIIAGKGCFTSPNPTGNKTLGTSFSVTSGGTGTGTFTLPTMNSVDGASNISALCVGHPTQGVSSAEGIFVPIKITAVS